VCWPVLRIDVDHYRLLVVLESTREHVPIWAFVYWDCEVDAAEEVWALFSCDHGASDLGLRVTGRLVNCVIQPAQGLLGETLPCYYDVTAETISRSRPWPDLCNVEKSEFKLIFVVVLAVERYLKVHGVALWPAAGCHYFQSCWV